MVEYDKYYKKENYFGKPYPRLMDFFAEQKRGTLVDLGAGQGRDSVPLAQMDYSVTAVDVSNVGLKQIKKSNPIINTVMADIYLFDVSGFDYVLLNSMLHFYKNDIDKEISFINQILTQMSKGAVLVNCLLKNKIAEKHLKDAIHHHSVDIINEEYIAYPCFEATYHLYVVKKI